MSSYFCSFERNDDSIVPHLHLIFFPRFDPSLNHPKFFIFQQHFGWRPFLLFGWRRFYFLWFCLFLGYYRLSGEGQHQGCYQNTYKEMR